MKNWIWITLIIFAVYSGFTRYSGQPAGQPAPVTPPADFAGQAQEGAHSGSDHQLAAAFEKRQSGVQVQGEGTVERILADDNDGSRHQRFILRLDSGQTLLVAHNIDLAPRISSLSSEDRVAFHGEYEWNTQGGVIHWTHHDPDGSHAEGWLQHRGRIYK